MIIGITVAVIAVVAVIAGVIFFFVVMPQLMALSSPPLAAVPAAPVAEEQQPAAALNETEQQHLREVEEEELLKQQDPEFARFMDVANSCPTAEMFRTIFGEQRPGDPSPFTCQQMIETAQANWCGPVGSANYHAVKCDKVHDVLEAYDAIRR